MQVLLAYFFIAEIILAFLFAAISQIFYKKAGLDFKSILKGIFERIFLTMAMFFDYPQALTFFSAIKLATRIKHKEQSEVDENKFNDFYLFGNFLSVIIAIIYTEVLKKSGLFITN
jgi:hypothetical protein